MKSFLFLLLAGYAVRCDENNYYVIDVPPSPTDTDLRAGKPFRVYWNVPTMQCRSKKVPFENLYEKFGIIQNENDNFKGEEVTILYDPGLFPALFKNESAGGKLRFRNGGVPQEGDLNKHLEEFKNELDKSIPDKKFNGTGIIDFESWRPTFRQNFGTLQPYKDVSIEIERKLHWWWQKKWLEEEAKRRFEEAARTFMQTTLSMAKKLRPRARWGFYGFPYCFNMASNNMHETCAKNVPQENDEIPWLWSESSALYPSVYSSASLSTSQLGSLIRGRIREAARCAADNKKDILPYFWFRYRDAGFLSENDLSKALSTLYESRATGILIWGSSNDVNTKEKCNKLYEYIYNTFGPAIAKYTKPIMRDTEENDTNNTLSTGILTENPLQHITYKVEEILDPEFHWSPPENYTQDLIKVVEEQINRRFGLNETGNETALQNNNVLIDLILNAVLRGENNASMASTEAPKTKYDKKTEINVLVSSTTEIYDKISTGTNQITNSIVTKNPFTNKDDAVTRPESETKETIKKEYVTTERASTVNEAINSVSIESQYETDKTDSNQPVTETVTTARITTETVTDIDYDGFIDNEEKKFLNIDTLFTLINNAKTETFEGTTASTGSDLTKSAKKHHTNTIAIYELYLGETTTENSKGTSSTDDTELLNFINTDTTLKYDEKTSTESGDYTTESNSILKDTEYLIPKETNANMTENDSSETTTDNSKILFETSTQSGENKITTDEYYSTPRSTEHNFIVSSEFPQVFTNEGTEMSKSTESETTEGSSTSIVPTEQVVFKDIRS